MVIEDLYAKNARGESLTQDEVNFLFRKLAEKSAHDAGHVRLSENVARLAQLDLLETRIAALKALHAHIDGAMIERIRSRTSDLVVNVRATSGRPTHKSLLLAAEAAAEFCDGYMTLIERIRAL